MNAVLCREKFLQKLNFYYDQHYAGRINRTLVLNDSTDEQFESCQVSELLIIINGCGRSGKDTFIKRVQEALLSVTPAGTIYINNISSIDPVRPVAQSLSQIADPSSVYAGGKENTRDLCAEIKKAWDICCDGSTKYLADKLNKIRVKGLSAYRLNFLHIREPDNIKHFMDLTMSGNIYSYDTTGVGVSTVLLYGRTNPEDFTNAADREVYNYNYDAYVCNDGSHDDLVRVAEEYAALIRQYFGL